MKNIRYKKLYRHLAPLLSPNDFFINIGANDGVTNDPVFDFIEPFSLKGIAIEPIDVAFKKLVENYKCFPGVQCLRASIQERASSLGFFRLREDLLQAYPALSQISTTNKSQILTTLTMIRNGELIPDPEKKIDLSIFDTAHDLASFIIFDDKIDCFSFNGLVEKLKILKIDFLNIDTEGHDFAIFMSIDLVIFKPKIIIIEDMFSPESEKKLINEKLEKFGYTFIQNFEYFSKVFIKSTAANSLHEGSL